MSIFNEELKEGIVSELELFHLSGTQTSVNKIYNLWPLYREMGRTNFASMGNIRRIIWT